MYIKVTEEILAQEFAKHGRLKDYSLEGLRAMLKAEEEREEGSENELDVIALCESWYEYESYVEAANDLENAEYEKGEERRAKAFLKRKTYVIEFNGGILVESY